MPDYDLHFSPFASDETGSFKLMELPPDLVTLVENALSTRESLDLCIKGDASEDAVLCTSDKTYSIRTVNLSNSVLVISPPPDTALEFSDDSIVIRDTVNQILELAPTVPKIAKLVGLLRGREYDESHEDDGDDEDEPLHKYTLTQAREDIQASEVELVEALKRKRILIIKDELRPISLPYLNNILQFILNILVARLLKHESAPVELLTRDLDVEHEISPSVARQVLEWFGEITGGGRWKMNVDEVIREVGLGILRQHKAANPIATGELLRKWKDAVGDAFEDRVGLTLLAGNYLEERDGSPNPGTLSYFPGSALPTDPAARFSDLFLTRPRWRVEDITPFLAEIAVNNKERDKLLLKYCRATMEAGVTWYTARAQYNG